jgi:hypothetical protein
MNCNNSIHELRGPLDVRSGTTECRRCYNDRQRRYSHRRTLAMTILKRLSAAGISEIELAENDGAAIALRWLAEESPRELARIEVEHPVLVSKVRHQLAETD